MWTVSARIIYFFIIWTLLLIIYQNSQLYSRACDQLKCWLQEKQQLNRNIARVCRKYGDSTEIIRGRFIKIGKLVNCLNAKVEIIN